MKRLVISKTQFSIVWNKLNKTKFISRNWALKRGITRLGAYMCEIKKAGFKISANYDITPTKRDYVYRLK